MYLGGNRRWVPLFVAGKLPQSSFAIPSFEPSQPLSQVNYLQNNSTLLKNLRSNLSPFSCLFAFIYLNFPDQFLLCKKVLSKIWIFLA